MKSFREWLVEKDEQKYINEGKLDVKSYTASSGPIRDIQLNTSKGEIGIWVNGGNSYIIKTDKDIIENMRSKFYGEESDKYMSKYLDKLAIDVAEFIAKEVSKWEKDFKTK